MANPALLQHHSYDMLMKRKNPMALRLHDVHHQNIQVGDLVEYQGHNSIMDRQRFRVVGKMEHPTLNAALKQIKKSNLGLRDKLQLKESFKGAHGIHAADNHPVVSLHLEPHHGSISGYNHSPGAL